MHPKCSINITDMIFPLLDTVAQISRQVLPSAPSDALALEKLAVLLEKK